MTDTLTLAKTAAVLSLIAIQHAAPLPASAESDNDQTEQNHAVVVRNMTDTLRSICLGGQQAAMLAEQTADFGTRGMLTTVAAIGLGPLVLNTIAGRKPIPRANA